MKLGENQNFASPEEALTALIPPEGLSKTFRVKPGTPEEVLKHHGVKGMRWGVRNEDEPVGRDASGRVEAKPLSPEVKERIAKITRTDHPQVLRPSSSASKDTGRITEAPPKEEHGLSRNQKIAIGVGAGAVLAGAGYIAYKHYTGNTMPGLNIERLSQLEREATDKQLGRVTIPKKWDTSGLKDGPISTQKLGDLAGNEINAKLKFPEKLAINTSRGFADIVPIDGFKGPHAAAAQARHDSAVRVLEQMRDKYPAIRNMNIEVLPMSHAPGLEGSKAEMCVMAMRPGEARLMYNDATALATKFDILANKKFLPGLGKKDYVAMHEMGHLLAVAHGDQPTSFHLLSDGASPTAMQFWQNTEPLLHRRTFAQHGFSFKELSKISQYAATQPAEAMAELFGHYSHPEMRQRLTPEQLARAEAMFNEMGGVR